ncbi:hypothetical protein ACFL59_06565 [Planctomycetota bacterium]
MVILGDNGRVEPSTPQRITELEARIRMLTERIRATVWFFREALQSYAAEWMRKTAKAVAVSQYEHTLKIGRGKLHDAKERVEKHLQTLADRITEEFTIEEYGDAPDVSSGQVNAVISRRFEGGIRSLLATLTPILTKSGYRRDEHLVEGGPTAGNRAGFPVVLDLPPDILEQIQKVADSITEIKIAESKILYFERHREKEVAADLWDDV